MTATANLRIGDGNAEQFHAWDGAEGAYWATHPDRFDGSIAVHHGTFMTSAAISAGEEVLDVGCGAGLTTIEAATANAGASAVGVDLSSALLAVARRRAAAAGVTNVEFLQADAQIHPFTPGSVDVVLARTSAMFFGDHAVAFANLRAATRHGGRIALLTWQPLEHNEWLTEIARALTVEGPPRIPPPGVGPFSLSDPDRLRELLSNAGYDSIEIASSAGPMVFGSDVEDAVAFILGLMGWMLDGLEPDARNRAIDALRTTCSHYHASGCVAFGSGTWLTTTKVA